MNSAEYNDWRIGTLRLLCQSKTVTDIVRQGLYFVNLIVMPKNYGILLFLQTDYLIFKLFVCHILSILNNIIS